LLSETSSHSIPGTPLSIASYRIILSLFVHTATTIFIRFNTTVKTAQAYSAG
jgi:hypothetical protein